MTLTEPAEGAEVVGNVEFEAVARPGAARRGHVRAQGRRGAEWTVLGIDDNPPYRIFHDVSGLAAGTPLQYQGDRARPLRQPRLRHGDGGRRRGRAAAEPGAARDYAVVHYQRADGAYDGWGVHVWGDVDRADVTWTTPKPLAGEDEFGRFAWVKLAPERLRRSASSSTRATRRTRTAAPTASSTRSRRPRSG